MRQSRIVFVMALALAAACSERPTDQPTGPQAIAVPTSRAMNLSGSSADSLAIESLILQLYSGLNGGNGLLNSAQTRFHQVAALYTNCTLNPPTSPCNQAGAQSNDYLLITDILFRYKSGGLNILPPPGTGAAVTQLINLLLQYTGLDADVCTFGTSIDCNATVYQPGSDPTILTTPSGQAGINLPPGTGTVTRPTVISVSRIDDGSGLHTQLDQYAYHYLYTSSSGQGVDLTDPFLQDVTVEVCLKGGQNLPAGALDRLTLAHDIAEPAPYENIQILPSGTGFLPLCEALSSSNAALPTTLAGRAWQAVSGTLAAVFAPSPLVARTMLATGTGITGGTKNLSPFGPVDPVAYVSAASATSGLWNVEGGTISGAGAPRVRVLTPAGNPMAGIEVTFAVTSGGGTLTAGAASGSSVVAHTDGAGYAAVASWTVGTGVNTLQATGSITPCDAAVVSGTVANCGTVEGIITFTAEAASKITATTPTSGQSAPAGTGVSTPPAVQVTDGSNNPVAGVPVRFDAQGTGTLTANGSTTPVASAIVITNAGGVAALDGWVVDVGLNTLTATAVDPANAAVSLTLVNNPVTFTATGTTTITELFCPPTNGAGDQISHGFVYLDVAKGVRLASVSLYLATNAPASFPNPFTFKVEVFQGGYNGLKLGEASKQQALKGSTSENKRTTFTFSPATLATSARSDLYFRITTPVNPSAATAYFAVGGCAPGSKTCKTTPACTSLTETVDNFTTPYVFYRKGLGADLFRMP